MPQPPPPTLSPQVALSGSALPAVESPDAAPAAKVSAAGSNRSKLRAGCGLLKGVRLAAEGEGRYVVRCAPSSRKVAVQDASLVVQVGGACLFGV